MFLTPVRSPAVSADPVVHSVLSAPSIQLDGVVGGVSGTSVVHIDSTRVILDTVCVDVCTHRTSHVDLRHDVLVSSHGTVLADGDLRVVLHSS